MGHGRIGRRWESPPGGLWMSVVLHPRISTEDLPKLSFLGALAVVRTLSEFSIQGKIKWPNDVLVDYKKIAGILVEKRGDNVVLGVGLNVNNEAPENATSMAEILGTSVPLIEVFRALVTNLDELYKMFLSSPASLLEMAKKEMILGVPVRIIGDGEIEGIAEDIDELGRLILRLSDGSLKKIVYGDVSLRFL